MIPEVISIVGPTASGKSALALQLAQQLDAEIVSLDAYQIYRGMDIGTAKASLAEQAIAKHHLLDVFEISYLATISDFTLLAQAAISDILNRGKTAVCVGGSGLYVQSVLEILELPPTDANIRLKYQQLLATEGDAWLHAYLAEIDPQAAADIEPANNRRVVRALEVNEITGQPFSARLSENLPRYRDLRIGISVDRQVLRAQIRARILRMIAAGWLDEVSTLVSQGLLETPTASKAIGYRELAAVQRGEIELDAAVELMTQATSRFAKRQISWFGRDSKIHWKAAPEWNVAAIEQLFD